MRLQQELGEIILRDPDVQAMGSQTGSTDSPNPANTGGFTIVLKPRDERTASARQIIDRLRPQFAQVPGANVFLQPTQDINVGARIGRGSYQYTLQDANVDELIEWSQTMLQRLRTLPELADATSDLLANAPQLKLTINRDQASRFGISPQLIDDTLNDAYGQRQITQYFTQLNTYFVILEILPELQANLASLDRLYVKSPLTGGIVPLSTFVEMDFEPGRTALGDPPGPVSLGHPDVQPPARDRARTGGRCHHQGRRRPRHAGADHFIVPGRRAGVPEFAVEHAGAGAGRADRRLHHPRDPV